jgi:hypothetical protein
LNRRWETNCENGGRCDRYGKIATTHFFNRKYNSYNANQAAREDTADGSRGTTPGRRVVIVVVVRQIVDCHGM